jgi:hypothetical protein
MAERVRRTESMREALLAEKERAADEQHHAVPAWPANIESKKHKTNEQEVKRGQERREITPLS